MVVRSNQLDRNLAGTIEKYGFFAEFRQKASTLLGVDISSTAVKIIADIALR